MKQLVADPFVLEKIWHRHSVPVSLPCSPGCDAPTSFGVCESEVASQRRLVRRADLEDLLTERALLEHRHIAFVAALPNKRT